MSNNYDAIIKKNLELLAEEYEETHQKQDSAAATIDYNIMMGNLEDPEEDENE